MADNISSFTGEAPRKSRRAVYIETLESMFFDEETGDTARACIGKILLDEDKKTAPTVITKQTITFKPIGDEAEAESA